MSKATDELIAILKTAMELGATPIPVNTEILFNMVTYTVALRAGIQELIDQEDGTLVSREVRNRLRALLGQDIDEPAPKTTEEKIEFRKAWDKRVEDSQ